MAQLVNRVALYQPHRACKVVGPNGLSAPFLLRLEEVLRHQVQGCFPGQFLPVCVAPLRPCDGEA